jgi:hypothetical protein
MSDCLISAGFLASTTVSSTTSSESKTTGLDFFVPAMAPKKLGRRVRRVDVHAALGQIDYAAQFDVNVQLFRAVIHRGRCEQ